MYSETSKYWTPQLNLYAIGKNLEILAKSSGNAECFINSAKYYIISMTLHLNFIDYKKK